MSGDQERRNGDEGAPFEMDDVRDRQEGERGRQVSDVYMTRAEETPVMATESTWSFVQMNMTLLPIARPLPVTICHRFQEGVLGRKPRTPNQKLHHRVLRNASNISPRRQYEGLAARRGSTSSTTESDPGVQEFPRALPQRTISAPVDIPRRCGKRKSDFEDTSYHASSSWQAPSRLEIEVDDLRVRSHSEDMTMQDVNGWSESPDFTLVRSASTSSAFAQRGSYKGKRILELQDEERRLHPDDRVALPSPSKRSRRLP
ncbi:hypothetical protein Poli38472_012965 [Pythium oligandrum]|uniref:Uncharacterized protein n=1 Tax=Pythium oligandrum TaxID=41045 RepID=A0A8K1CL46_PYTOL|nr:hypothetical protein Poli38472_012965 [Pythium oligandrum]|eukprot:TMW64343.1 hypothetical protein Poli38472_012965 [Pythium oligandrum]